MGEKIALLERTWKEVYPEFGFDYWFIDDEFGRMYENEKQVAELTEKLGHTSDQAKQLDAILLERHSEVKSIHDQSDAQLEQVRQKGRDQIRAVLTPEQKPKFEEFLAKLDAERKHNAPR